MRKAGWTGAFLGAAALIAFAAVTPGAAGSLPSATFAPTGDTTSVPYGWVDFCRRYTGECETGGATRDIRLSAKTYKTISSINKWVNSNIEPMSDMTHWGVVDRWDYPNDGKGDCEDYLLLKRKMLMEEGFPRSALLVTVVKDKKGEGHAVLTVKTDRGEFILDNMTDKIVSWDKTGYRFVKRQSQDNPNVWVSIGEPTEAPAYVSR
jgi:predicted transglutaminase-like cysteine proteinase